MLPSSDTIASVELSSEGSLEEVEGFSTPLDRICVLVLFSSPLDAGPPEADWSAGELEVEVDSDAGETGEIDLNVL